MSNLCSVFRLDHFSWSICAWLSSPTNFLRQNDVRQPRSGLCVSYFLSIQWEKLTQKSWAILQNFNSCMTKLTKTPFLPNCQVPNGFFVCVTVNLSSNNWSFAKLLSFFWVNFSRERKIWENWEKNWNIKSDPKMKAERARYRSSSTLSSFSGTETTNCYRQVCFRFQVLK